ncbi:hypothetical protein GIB67_042589, partial [Kingdonia uniflora]
HNEHATLSPNPHDTMPTRDDSGRLDKQITTLNDDLQKLKKDKDKEFVANIKLAETSECKLLRETINQIKEDMKLKRVLYEQCALAYTDLPGKLDTKILDCKNLQEKNASLEAKLRQKSSLEDCNESLSVELNKKILNWTSKYKKEAARYTEETNDLRMKLVNAEEMKKTLEVNNNEWSHEENLEAFAKKFLELTRKVDNLDKKTAVTAFTNTFKLDCKAKEHLFINKPATLEDMITKVNSYVDLERMMSKRYKSTKSVLTTKGPSTDQSSEPKKDQGYQKHSKGNTGNPRKGGSQPKLVFPMMNVRISSIFLILSKDKLYHLSQPLEPIENRLYCMYQMDSSYKRQLKVVQVEDQAEEKHLYHIHHNMIEIHQITNSSRFKCRRLPECYDLTP